MTDPNSAPRLLDREDEGDPRDQEALPSGLATRNSLPLVAQRNPGRDVAVVLAGFTFVGLVGAVTFSNLTASREGTAPTAQPRAASAPAAAASEIAPAVPAAAITPVSETGTTVPMPNALPAAPAPSAAPPVIATNPNGSATVVFDASALPLAAAPADTPAGPAAAGATPNANDEFAGRIGVGGAKAVATAAIDPKATVTQGTLIPAVLETAINTDVPGYVRAVVSADVRSFDGSRVLIPRSSRLIGQYKSGLQAGQKRAYVIWTRLIRPDGVSVNIGSPAVGFSGETGLGGKVQTHFFERFGSAMLLSVIGGLSAIGGNSGVVIASSGQSAAAAAVGQSAQIGPTVRVRLGEPIRVFTARDLDFSKVMSD